MTGLTTFALKANVLTALQTLIPTYADIVQLGLPADVPPIDQPTRVYILNVPAETPAPVFGPSTQIRKSDYALPIALEVVSYTGNDLDGQAQVLTVMQALVAAIEAIQASDAAWGAAVMQSGLALAAESTGPIEAQAGGWIAKAILELHVMREGV